MGLVELFGCEAGDSEEAAEGFGTPVSERLFVCSFVFFA